MIKIDYNKEMDILVVEEGDYDCFDRNIELGGFILDLDPESDFIGLEIIDASQKISLTKEELNKIDSAEVKYEKNDEVIRIELILEIDSTKNVISSQYPSSALAQA